MSGRGDGTRAELEIVRLCRAGLDRSALRQQLMVLLRRLLPVDAAFLAAADPDTLLFTDAFAEEPLDAATALFLDNEFGSLDVNKFATLATSSRPVAWLDQTTHDDRMSSPRYRDIMRPLGLGDELRAALIVDRQCWGFLCLHREDHHLGFTASEGALIARISSHLAAGLRQAVLLHARHAPDRSAPGVVVLSEDLSPLAMTAEAEQLLSLVEGAAAAPLPVPVYAVAAALLALEQGVTSTVQPTARVPTRTGPLLKLHASRLPGPPGEGRIAVVVETAEASAAASMLLSVHGLTSREAEVARLVLRGSSTQVIANTLHISEHTVQDHLKAVFDKVGVRSRRDLVGQLLGAGQAL
jgi:DNA-binding CsgD family transcriptional regulator/GAF domain-containing protein